MQRIKDIATGALIAFAVAIMVVGGVFMIVGIATEFGTLGATRVEGNRPTFDLLFGAILYFLPTIWRLN